MKDELGNGVVWRYVRGSGAEEAGSVIDPNEEKKKKKRTFEIRAVDADGWLGGCSVVPMVTLSSSLQKINGK
ncbi:unnamed protein product [Allacma fusca]|uniref:Uncharacterized protein n=1 Tax=Allacma fusca TaxID=39272 RepID=A0A8J2NP42_9HEXA|nr:unnamed protein product [Allacma fusca]